ncbi:TetR/AcrR family transcriptional regulator [Xanthomonas euvesicatoria]|uniref:TetR/AcrR family transcriptional regulator n=1 Tax=Xanthomonas euvesicatoria TaxID=456327 RepID=UPI001C4943C1|nr:TetR family transcriptional regulator [Xanthomonas euvesicatoria]MBV6864108.1 TetR family transcriptional regulator [Xanthomonas campestris pv. coriandri]MCE4327690.1 TetR family transcriptional regulator [Xanthomonas campestris pv. coriandri]
MNSFTPYVRARSVEQKEERRRHLLATARAMLDDSPGALDLGINELARQAQMTKSNVYRYFESSEAVLIDVLVEEYAGWQGELGAAFAQGDKAAATVESIAAVFAQTLCARPLLCRLTSIMPSILERKVSFERMVEFKLNLLALRHQAAQAFHARLPEMSADAFDQVIKYALPLVIGLWPLSNPVDVAAQVIALPELERLRYDFQHDVERAVLTLMRGARD